MFLHKTDEGQEFQNGFNFHITIDDYWIIPFTCKLTFFWILKSRKIGIKIRLFLIKKAFNKIYFSTGYSVYKKNRYSSSIFSEFSVHKRRYFSKSFTFNNLICIWIRKSIQLFVRPLKIDFKN